MTDLTYLLRTSNAERRAHGGFQYPESGTVVCPDWSPSAECGHGLHGLLMGEGDGSLLNWAAEAVWQVLAVDPATVVELSGKVKVPRADVVYSGDRAGAVQMILDKGGIPGKVVGSTVSGGDGSTVSGGDGSTVSGGDGSTVSGGDGSTVSGGVGSTVSGGDGSTVSGGYRSTVSGGYRSTVSGGDGSTVSGGDGSTVSGGYGSRTISRYRAKAGAMGCVVVFWWDGERDRAAVGYIGEGGITADTWYQVVDGKLTEVAND